MTDSTAAAPDFDVAIVGAGPVGLALANWLLRDTDWRIALFDARDPEAAARDPRALALSHGSRVLLQEIGGWPARATPITHIHVSQRGHFGQAHIRREDYDVPALGHVVQYGDLSAALNTALAAQMRQRPDRLTRYDHTPVERVEQLPRADGTVAPARVRALREGRHPLAIETEVVIQAEGGLFDDARRQAGSLAHARRRDYGQTAIVAHVHCGAPLEGWAWERFTPEGPLALLPQDDVQGPGYALVWCCSPGEARRRAGLPDEAFLAELGMAFGDRMGRFTHASARHTFALGLHAQRVPVDRRVAAIGNAAQTIHPVAGQGFNLGLRDAFEMARALRDGATPAALARFARERTFDRAVTIGLTDLLPRAFAVPGRTFGHLRGAALTLIECLPPLKHGLARQMMFGQRG
ncbi:UbiH/UbiF/VisC/COQ6 family ubiquinone biosynthesis hydroxylase [Ralstonia mannitolilytica]|uniref:2-octaprenyl-6-methoxyphenol hydroxylase n=1 Tax=Ralstonia mannitolilytica TaxID=105219 RepID=A0AAD2EI97_9RALS|nr:UbiH/UbiF/VisC/COQ6 family ubiquinone biosynthesis hydroxylase [Ralstonia mannitolilytica]MBY4720910.1 UbiH/UbiF/VisC/COQ6 family ubiquinone biosynthesis hydroxylase [Ralstonia mannitolilytica]CAJ0684033.1 2-octaprenyl-6-methoxyphenol hydroxylase [Ralstonia mannitolilytica]CAJ0691722.1 2-octaprenyl-6-methoxyphenol hydroxylase [Ralstonia mannitolilytica]CAJ0717346.1 2-octaprenyl-6-methoxyphenol hydroxylase [Ralstonia mannitolilytica]CAJ0873327.1 2-octaprenyl-6-methoxyphenol hydroxylase [Rals